MIKRILNLFSIFIIIGVSIIWYIGEKKEVISELKGYILKTNYSYIYQKDRKMNIEIFLNDKNNLLKYKEENQIQITDKLENNIFDFEIDDVKIISSEEFKGTKYYSYLIILKIPDLKSDFLIEEAYIKIKNQKNWIEAPLGTLEIIYDDSKFLDYKDIFPIFNEYEGMNTLAAISLKIDSSYHGKIITDIKLSKNLSVDSSEIFQTKEELNNETELTNFFDFKFSGRKEFDQFKINANEYIVIPIHYSRKNYVNNAFFLFKIDGEWQKIDNIIYLSSSFELKNVETAIKKIKFIKIE